MKVLVTGSRDYLSPERVKERIDQLPPHSTVIHGGARGPDSVAGIYAACTGHRVLTFKADWEAHGKKAGVIRNLLMLDEQPDLVIAFWDGSSRGTAHTIKEAQRRGIKVEIIPP